VRTPRSRGVFVVVLSLTLSAHARDVRVTDVPTLRAAVASAMAGDVITLAPGTYRLTSKLSCTAAGTAASRIVLRSETPFAARVESDTVIAIGVSGPYWTFEGLEVRGVCANDSDCEHAFQVTGGATDVVLRGNKLIDFNAQLKVNADVSSPGNALIPHRGLVERNEVFDTGPRNLGANSNPVTKLNIDTGDDWVVRDNFIHDWRKNGGNFVAYGVFLKSGGKRGVLERNLVICGSPAVPLQPTNDARIGLSFGGGGTAPQFCGPAFDANTPCAIEHEDGVARNNVVINCSDVALYVNRGRNTRVLYNTFIATGGVDFRFATTTGAAVGNVTSSNIRARDQGTFTAMSNLTGVSQATFDGWYVRPLAGDLTLRSDGGSLLGAGPRDALVTDDFCGRPRPASGNFTQGALEASFGSCATQKPPDGGLPVMVGGGVAGGQSAGGAAGGVTSAGGGAAAGGGATGGGGAGGGGTGEAAGGGQAGTASCDAGQCGPATTTPGCGCAMVDGQLAGVLLVMGWARRRRRRVIHASEGSPATTADDAARASRSP
jgi:hypothetical protein